LTLPAVSVLSLIGVEYGGWGCAHGGGVDHLGRGFAQERSPGLVVQEELAAQTHDGGKQVH
jgi:hypothetical protein